MGNDVFVTGATGFVGRRLVRQLSTIPGRTITLLARDADRLPPGTRHRDGIRIVEGDLLEPSTYRDALSSCSQVVHLAATTGKASRTQHQLVNHLGTERLLAAAKACGVREFLFVSTIAARFDDAAGYHYARAKHRAEEAVRESGIAHTILRPTIVAGAGSPVLSGLTRLARMPLVPVFGRRNVRVQLLHVDDLARLIAAILDQHRFRGEVLEAGAPDPIRIEDLLARLRGRPLRRLRLPLSLSRGLLRALEPGLRPVLPLTAGQLALFANEGVAADPIPPLLPAGEFRSLDEILDERGGEVGADPRERRLLRECRTFGRYLSGGEPGPGVRHHYLRFHEQRALRAGRFDRLLMGLASRAPVLTRLADAYAVRFRKEGPLRVKLVLLLALLEVTPGAAERYDGPRRKGRAANTLGLALDGVVEGLSVLLSSILLLPAHALLSLLPDRDEEHR